MFNTGIHRMHFIKIIHLKNICIHHDYTRFIDIIKIIYTIITRKYVLILE